MGEKCEAFDISVKIFWEQKSKNISSSSLQLKHSPETRVKKS